MQNYSNFQLLICFNKVDAKVVMQYQKIDFILKTILHSSLLAKNCFCSVVSTDQFILLLVDEFSKKIDISTILLRPLSINESDKKIDVSIDLFIPSLIDKLNKKADVLINQFIPSPIDKPNKEVDKNIYLFHYFTKNVLWFIFLIVKVSLNHIIRSIIDSLESNSCFLNFCFSITAIYLKYMKRYKKLTKANIIQQWDAAIWEYFKTIKSNYCNYQLVLEVALSIIFIPYLNDFLNNIPWHYYLKARALLVKKLRLLLQHLFISLTIWINIFGAIIVACFSIFAYVYYEIRQIRIALRLFQLIECKNKIIYIIFKIICLEKLKASSTINHVQPYNCVIALSIILNKSELAFKSNYLYSLDRALVLNLFFENISVIFHIATKINLYNVIDSKNVIAISGVINNFIIAIHYIFLGFEYTFVWLLPIVDSMSMLQSTYYNFFISQIADASKASFGRFDYMMSLVWKVWYQSK